MNTLRTIIRHIRDSHREGQRILGEIAAKRYLGEP